ncbi:MAG: hypothetical protein M1269_13100 [Chloroflexi bacterium]|nr:hypothetical protein [Chloroflexota bacterium]
MNKIGIAFVDDWELRGSGGGNVTEHQHKPALRLMDIYEKHGIKGSFTAETLQQLAFRKAAAKHEELLPQIELWDETLKTMIRRGHDVQLHLHIQWHDAEYKDGTWEVGHNWNIADYPEEIIDGYIARGKQYLENLLKPITPGYSACVFRSGAWAMSPGRTPLECLIKNGIDIDISVCYGVYFHNEHYTVDYRVLEEPFFPYYPDLDDIKKVSDRPAAIVEVPTQSLLRRSENHIVNFLRQLKGGLTGNKNVFPRDPFNICALPLFDMKYGIDDIMKRFLKSPLPFVPAVLENHTKDLQNFDDIDMFISYIKEKYGRHVSFITLREMRDFIIENKDETVRIKK